MKQANRIERTLLWGHLFSMAFGLAGLLVVLPNPELVAQLPDIGKTAFSWSLAGGGVIYMLLGCAAVAVYAYRTLGVWHWLGFMIPAIGLSLGSELLGTSTGFPFGHYRYLTGLGYKIAGLVPFTIPLSWFYLGFSAYIIARLGLNSFKTPSWVKEIGAIVIGSVLLTSWDFVLDPAMSQTAMPFWVWDQPGAFFGMPYQNFAGWFGTGVVYMTVAVLLWKVKPLRLPKIDLSLPLVMYLSNFGFATIMSMAEGIYPPVLLGVITGVIPVVILYLKASNTEEFSSFSDNQNNEYPSVKMPVASVGGNK
ncbi:gamma-carotene 1'-hydroxylase CruF [Gloeothece citriformis]|nr:carotenoid biosynthesis protein [Gloeothece citriformis]